MIRHHHNNGDYDNIVYNPSTLNNKKTSPILWLTFFRCVAVSPKMFHSHLMSGWCYFCYFYFLPVYSSLVSFNFFFVTRKEITKPRGVRSTSSCKYEVYQSLSHRVSLGRFCWVDVSAVVDWSTVTMMATAAMMAASNFDEFDPFHHLFNLFHFCYIRTHTLTHTTRIMRIHANAR